MTIRIFWKTIRNFLILILISPTLVYSEVADDAVWEDAAEEVIAKTAVRQMSPTRYRLLSLNRQVLNPLLKQIPLETAGRGGVVMTMPLPEGGFGRFRVVESPIMAPELAAKFPQLKTYRGSGIDDPSASIRFSFTPAGLHAMILSAGATVYVDPYQSGDSEHHISYLKQNYNANDQPPFQCHFQNDSPRALLAQKTPPDRLPFGTQLRTYRLALAATGEYTDFQCNQSATCDAGSSVAVKQQTALTAMVVAMNRVNGIYERDVAVRMTLIGNNDQIIFTDALSDPYSNNSGGAMLGENQTTLDTIIGDANYDIGHVFSTGGGGVATLQSPCSNGSKARGVTGLPAPVGDPFYVDFVSHEIGHQYGGRHTFNGTSGNCAGGNRTAATAYEPGSGTTIMAYAGICPPQNIQANSDDHFHAVSLDEIIAFISGNAVFDGDVCAVKTATGNTPPSAEAGSNANPAFTIPINTPFELAGSASDANGDALTYIWEQFDRGPAGAPDSPGGNAPIFRSFAPATGATRSFPQLSDIVNNTQTLGELLPGYSRALTFRLTVRDNRSGGGGIDTDTLLLQASAAAGPFLVTAPDTAVSWAGLSTQTVSWDVANTSNAAVNCSNVDILLSSDGGTTFPTTVLAGTANDGSQNITVPNVATTQARLKIGCSSNVFFDMSNVDFTITAETIDFLNFSKAFDGPAAAGGSATLTFTIENSSTTTTLSDLSFSDDLDAVISGLTATSLPAANVCGTGSQLSGTSLLSLTDGNLGPLTSCTFSVTLQVPITATSGSFVSTTSDLSISGVSVSNPASATLTIEEAPPTFSKNFTPDSVASDGVSTLTFTIDNTASSLAAGALGFTDNLPAAMVVANPSNAATTCTGGTLTAAVNSSVISYSGGSIGAGAGCTIQVDVFSSAAGTHLNTSGDLTSTSGSSGSASATLMVNAPPAFSKSFFPDFVIAGFTSTLTFSIDNSAGTPAADNLDFVDNLPSGMTVADPANASTTCSGGTLTALTGAGVIGYSGGSVAAGGSCTVQVDVTGTIGGVKVNTTGDLTSSLGNSGTASASITLLGEQIFSDQFESNP